MNAQARRRAARGISDRGLVGFVVGDVEYALEIHSVREVLQPVRVRPVPEAPRAVVGVADHRGEVIPIVDARRFFGLPERATDRTTKWILLGDRQTAIGLVVDRVTDVFGSDSAPRPALPVLGDGAQRGIAYVASREGELVFVLDPSELTRLASGAIEAGAP